MVFSISIKKFKINFSECLVKQIQNHLTSSCQLSTARLPQTKMIFLLHYPECTKPANKKTSQHMDAKVLIMSSPLFHVYSFGLFCSNITKK